MTKQSRPRLIALGVARQGDRVFVSEGIDPDSGEIFYRPLGGCIEFGERAAQTVIREVREEIGAAVTITRSLGTLENLFTYAGEPGHEIVLLFEFAFDDPAHYTADADLPRLDDMVFERRALWLPLSFFEQGRAPLYPDGLLELLLSTPPTP